MSYWSALSATAALPTDLVALGVVGSTAKVYPGRKPKDKPDRLGEVWLELLPTTGHNGGLQSVAAVLVNIHVRMPGNPGPTQTGATLVTAVEAKLETIRAAYDGKHRMVGVSGLSDLWAHNAETLEVDDDPDIPDVLDGVVRVTFLFKE